MQYLALALAAGLGAFVIVLLSAVGAYVVFHRPAAAAVAVVPSTPVAAGNADPSGVPAPVFGDLPVGNNAPQQGDQPSASGYAFTAGEAAAVAQSSVPGSSLAGQPRLVNFAGTTAYEVTLDRGLVYIDASTAQVLYNGAQDSTEQSRPRHYRPGR